MKNIVVKSGVRELPLFAAAARAGKKYPYLEAYLSGEETESDLNLLRQTEMKLISLHMPASVRVDGEKVPVDFCRNDAVGKASYAKLEELIDFSLRNEVKFIVIHLGFFNALKEDRYRILSLVAERFRRLVEAGGGKVRLCLENVPAWTNICFENEPIISDEEHLLYFRERCPGIGTVFDVDHLAIDAVFRHFYPRFKEKRKKEMEQFNLEMFKKEREIFNLEKFKKEMEEEIAQSVRLNEPFFRQLVESRLNAFLTAVQPEIVHACGSDYCHYRLIDRLPLIGESLPLLYDGKVKGFKVRDKIDHQKWLSLLPEEVYITLELMNREDYDYLESIEDNYRCLSSWLEKK